MPTRDPHSVDLSLCTKYKYPTLKAIASHSNGKIPIARTVKGMCDNIATYLKKSKAPAIVIPIAIAPIVQTVQKQQSDLELQLGTLLQLKDVQASKITQLTSEIASQRQIVAELRNDQKSWSHVKETLQAQLYQSYARIRELEQKSAQNDILDLERKHSHTLQEALNQLQAKYDAFIQKSATHAQSLVEKTHQFEINQQLKAQVEENLQTINRELTEKLASLSAQAQTEEIQRLRKEIEKLKGYITIYVGNEKRFHAYAQERATAEAEMSKSLQVLQANLTTETNRYKEDIGTKDKEIVALQHDKDKLQHEVQTRSLLVQEAHEHLDQVRAALTDDNVRMQRELQQLQIQVAGLRTQLERCIELKTPEQLSRLEYKEQLQSIEKEMNDLAPPTDDASSSVLPKFVQYYLNRSTLALEIAGVIKTILSDAGADKAYSHDYLRQILQSDYGFPTKDDGTLWKYVTNDVNKDHRVLNTRCEHLGMFNTDCWRWAAHPIQEGLRPQRPHVAPSGAPWFWSRSSMANEISTSILHLLSKHPNETFAIAHLRHEYALKYPTLTDPRLWDMVEANVRKDNRVFSIRANVHHVVQDAWLFRLELPIE